MLPKIVLPHFRQNKKGIIINISSIGGKMTLPLGSYITEQNLPLKESPNQPMK
jgi:NADP-dependent 3-hydroxy acid dehydrogenase YdfG